jgi:LmbE family N-acetylglucosaminyl deacetylase
MFPYFLMNNKTKTIAIVVAHPDDETLWAGGTILGNPGKEYFIASLCRKNDPDRAPKFARVLNALGANGIMGDLDDQPEQIPLADEEVEQAILQLLPARQYDLAITHSIYGEYTRHRRHEEIGRAMINLWASGRLIINEFWAFAYSDGGRSHLPVADTSALLYNELSPGLWEKKYDIITEIYGFEKNSWEARTTPRAEAFHQFFTAGEALAWRNGGNTTS